MFLKFKYFRFVPTGKISTRSKRDLKKDPFFGLGVGWGVGVRGRWEDRFSQLPNWILECKDRDLGHR
ncbi:hypothetical protein H5410_058318 [Solanum commersonii]|uniref:Uncharacterized protein n=1 Tax=Solanum commersonii TaxID=4109 RepID=A0A9J5WT76_SOLCO|nr:hypothetical protein H5410_058318 [Solanum commersonii]